MPCLPGSMPSTPSGFARRAPRPLCVSRDSEGEGHCYCRDPPKTGEEDLDGGTGAPSGKGLGIHLCPRQHHPLFSLLGIATTAPRKVGGWLRSGRSGTAPQAFPKKGRRGVAAGRWKRGLLPRTHPLLLCRTVRPGILRKAGLGEPFP